VVLKFKRLKTIQLGIQAPDLPEADFGNIKKPPPLGIFNFRAFPNLAIFMTESHRAALVRQMILLPSPCPALSNPHQTLANLFSSHYRFSTFPQCPHEPHQTENSDPAANSAIIS